MNIKNDRKYTDALNRIIKRIDFVLYLKSIRGNKEFADPWFDFSAMEKRINDNVKHAPNAFKLLLMGIPAPADELSKELDDSDIEAITESGIWSVRDGIVSTNNLCLTCYEGIKLLVEINPGYKTCTHRNTDVYIGFDSLRLAENIVFDKGADVLDLCSGSGIQGILAARSAKKVVSVEINENACPVTLFNIRLNGLDDVIELRQGDLYSVIREDEKFDYIYANPPFIPMLDNVEYPVCGTGGKDGLVVLRKIFKGLPDYLKENGSAVIFCECLGNSEKVFFNDEVSELGKNAGFHVTQLLYGRIAAEHQIEKAADVTALMNESFDRADFIRKMMENYKSLSAEYYYNMLYKVTMSSAPGGEIRIIDKCNRWGLSDKARFPGLMIPLPEGDMIAVYCGRRKLAVIDKKAWELLTLFRNGLTVKEASDAIYEKYYSGKRNPSRGACLSGILKICNTLEKQRVIKKIR